jgi:hypothetical protein
MMHLLRLTFRFQLYSGKTILSAVFRVNLESAMRVPQTQSIFHLRAQRNAFHRDARQQSRSFAPRNRRHVADPVSSIETRSPPGLLAPTLVALPSMSRVPRAPLKLARLPACSLLPSSLYLLCRASRALHSQVYGTRKNFPVYGSFTMDPDAKSVTSTHFPSSGV